MENPKEKTTEQTLDTLDIMFTTVSTMETAVNLLESFVHADRTFPYKPEYSMPDEYRKKTWRRFWDWVFARSYMMSDIPTELTEDVAAELMKSPLVMYARRAEDTDFGILAGAIAGSGA